MSQPERQEALLLLRKAWEDADAIEKFAPDEDIADSVIGFHAEQAAEKAMKSVLTAYGDKFPWTHDLRHLIDRLDAIGRPLPEPLREVRSLAPWAVEFRYGETIDDLLDRDEAVTFVRTIIAWAETEVDTPAQTQRITGHDKDRGQLRIPSRSMRLFPDERATLTVSLRGMHLDDVHWDPRNGPDRERSGVLGIGKDAASRLVEGETLRIIAIDGGVQLD